MILLNLRFYRSWYAVTLLRKASVAAFLIFNLRDQFRAASTIVLLFREIVQVSQIINNKTVQTELS